MMTDVSTRYSRAKAGPTPGFVALCKTLYGDIIDPYEVWDTVIKASPDQADQNAHSGNGAKILRGTALGGAVLGGAIGARELGWGIKGARAEMGRSQQVLPGMERVRSKMSSKTKRQLAVGGTLAAADSLEIGVLGRDVHNSMSHKRGQLQPTGVGKGATSEGIHAAVAGLRTHINTAAGHLEHVGGNKMSAGAKPHFDSGLPSSAKPASVKSSVNVPPTPVKEAGKESKFTSGARNLTNAVNTPEGRAGAAVGVTATLGAGHLRNRSRENSMYGDQYAKNDVTWQGTFSKIDEDQHLAFGWASVVNFNGQPVIDKQGDYIDAEEIEKAAYSYVLKSRVGGNMHARASSDSLLKSDGPHKVSDLVESIVFTDEKVSKMGLPDNFPRGWWVGFKIHDEPTWEMVKKGERTGFSIHGKGIRKDADTDSIMGYTT